MIVRRASVLLVLLATTSCGESPPAAPGDLAVDAALDLSAPQDFRAGADLTRVEDLTALPCKGTADDCGPRVGECTSCANSSLGHACVKLACGCATVADCDPGSACVDGACAATGCSDASPCSGGCCAAGTCVSGKLPSACGASGGACVVCGAGTPTCSAGACTAACVAGKAGAPGVCGDGYCCGAGDVCTKVADASCGGVGELCRDCGKSPSGPRCLAGGACGCATAADCQPGQACKAGACGAACDANAPCNGGCCASGSCVAGETGGACAVGGALCASCAQDPKGRACVVVSNVRSCGCASQKDCPAGRACDPSTRQCGTACDGNRPCNGGCCLAGQCAAGTATAACGESGAACVDCAGSPGGLACVATPGGGRCGCSSLAECPMTAASCDLVTHLCNQVCSTDTGCAAGCCSKAVAGTCLPGTTASACGGAGVCFDCAADPAGHACRPTRTCGCDGASDCAPGLACDAGTHTCTAFCGPNQPCNGGCCASGSCVAGASAKACGAGGTSCLDCTKSKVGHACVAGGCGCKSASDSGPLEACDVAKGVCTSACGPNQPCLGGCCLAGQCSAGAQSSACGASGGACVTCGGGTPTCVGGACTAACGGVGQGSCSGGFCCAKGTCVVGNTTTTCGEAGACFDCSAAPAGSRCIVPQGGKPYFCGCQEKGDCRAADGTKNLPGQACDTSKSACTSSCGSMKLTACNKGCCSGPNGHCTGGGQDEACGSGGGFCSNCSVGCSPGPLCDPKTGSCGCTIIDDCFFEPRCEVGTQREACSPKRRTCCIPQWFNGNKWEDNGNPSSCCTGKAVKGICTCIAVGQASGGDPAVCCSQHEASGTCTCLPGGASCLAESDSNGECCSGQCVDVGAGVTRCIDSTAGQPCQSDAGCKAPLKCNLTTHKCG